MRLISASKLGTVCALLGMAASPTYATELGLASSPAPGTELFDGKVEIKGAIMSSFQELEADDNAFNVADRSTDSGFNRIRFSLGFDIQVSERINAFVELSEEPNDFGTDDQFEISNDLSFINYMLTDDLTFRLGGVVTAVRNFGGYSDGAVVQGNPLIGNSPADMVTAESGFTVLGSHDIGSGFLKRVNWDATVTVPTFFEDFGGDRGYDYFFKGSLDLPMGFSVGGGYAFNDLGDQVTGDNPRPFSEVQTMGMVQGDGDNYNFPGSGAGARDTHAGLVPGLEVDVWQIGAQYEGEDIPLYARIWFGRAEDKFSFGDSSGNQTVASQATQFLQQTSEMQFYGTEASYYIMPSKLYGAVRYTLVTNESDNAGPDDELTRTQVGGGYWLNDVALVKAEYVSQQEGANSPGQIGDDWDGFMLEASVVF
ncbi:MULTISPECIES: hypothetical protein [Marinobacter]|uniref:Porin n=1 Tax=Marinobacter metalliresistant TaxID=2961995 RepID=A0ABZ2W5Q3_9GAMM|nr:hypothetical protein [Marinobacter sp. Arc7-DN-1]